MKGNGIKKVKRARETRPRKATKTSNELKKKTKERERKTELVRKKEGTKP